MKTPFHDFAGSTVVHSIGGFIALAGAIALGPRLGRKFKRDGGGMPPGHDMAIAAVGGVILWFGWYGFNPGSTLSAMDFEGIGRVATNTTLAACRRPGSWRCSSSIHERTSGTRASRSTASWPDSSPSRVRVIGCRRSVRSVSARSPVSSWSSVSTCSSTCGSTTRSVRGPFTGSAESGARSSLGLFATGQYGGATSTGADPSTSFKGLFYGGGFHQLQFQIFGSLVICAVTFAIALVDHVRAQGARCAADLARSTSSKVSTSSSTVRRPTTPSTPTWATRRSRAGGNVAGGVSIPKGRPGAPSISVGE